MGGHFSAGFMFVISDMKVTYFFIPKLRKVRSILSETK